MDNGLITMVTPTVGNGSARRLLVLLREMRAFTKLDYRHIVVDDGTISDGSRAMTHEICKMYGAEYIENTAPFGASFALNRGFFEVKSRWAYIVDDGTRPSLHWLEAAMEWARNTGEAAWGGRRIGMTGATSMDALHLAMAGVFGEDRDPENYRQTTMSYRKQIVDDFYGDWNDGLWNWDRLGPLLWDRFCKKSPTTPLECRFRDLFHLLDPPGDWNSPLFRERLAMIVNPNHLGGFWPRRRYTSCSYHYGSPLALINMELFKKVGRFRDYCWLYEGHLAMRFGLAGYLVCVTDLPSWLHLNYQASYEAQTDAHHPRHQYVEEIFHKDFGCGTLEAANLVDKKISFSEQMKINKEFYKHPIRSDF